MDALGIDQRPGPSIEPSPSAEPGSGTEQGSSTENEADGEPAGWTRAEQYQLYKSIKKSDSYDVDYIHAQIPTKTPEQIQAAINYFKEIADSRRETSKKGKKGGRPRSDANFKPSLPLSQWAKYLTDNIDYDDLQTEVATALRIIAEYEDIPPPHCTENIDFRKAYHLLANAVEGKDLNVEDDKFLTMLIGKCILETAMTSKVFVQNTTVKQIVQNIDLTGERTVKTFQRPVTNKESEIAHHFSQQKNYNPLNIPEEYLRSTKD